jgi:hydrogenase maturation protease
VVEALKTRLADRPDVEVSEDYWGGLRLMERMIGFDGAIVVDAIQSGAPPGTIHRLTPDGIPTQRSASAHDMNLSTALAFGRQAGMHLPENNRIRLVGIEAEDILTFSEQCTPMVQAAIPRAIDAVLDALDAFSGGDSDMISPEVLRRYPYFAGIDEESLKQLAMIAEEKAVPVNTVMFREGDPASHLSIIVKGEVNIQYILGNGELRTVDTLVDGDLLMWSALVEPYKATALGTTTRETHLVRIDAAKLRLLCEQEPILGYRLMTQVARLLAHRLEGARVQLAVV